MALFADVEGAVRIWSGYLKQSNERQSATLVERCTHMSVMTVEAALQRFRDAAIGNAARDPVTANKWHDVLHSCYNILKETEDGRRGLVRLMKDENPYVRLCAAARSLQRDRQEARRVLEALREDGGPGAFDAKWTLIEFDKGRLTFDY